MMGQINHERILTLLGTAQKALGYLRDYQGFPDEDLLSSGERLGNIKYQWVILIEACIDICSHFSARLYGRTPESYSGCFTILHEMKVIDADLAEQLGELARFRNVLVHLYWEVDNRRVIEHTKTRLEIIEHFLKEIGTRIQ